jgi:hypothetical protein
MAIDDCTRQSESQVSKGYEKGGSKRKISWKERVDKVPVLLVRELKNW